MSSFPKHHCLHRTTTLFSAFLIVASFFMILKKECRLIPIEDNSDIWMKLVNNQTMQGHYIDHYYDQVQTYHIVIVSIDVLIFLLAFLNIAPSQEDIRFGFHLLLIITLGIVTLLTCYTAYVSFQMPCHASARLGDKMTSQRQVYQHNKATNAAKGTPVNAYIEFDIQILLVTGLDALCCFLFLVSTLVLCADAREEAIQDEYVARVRTSIY